MLCFEYLLAILIFHLLNPPTGLELVISHHCAVVQVSATLNKKNHFSNLECLNKILLTESWGSSSFFVSKSGVLISL